MVGWQARELVVSAVMAAFGALWLSAAWAATGWAPPYNIALKFAFAFICFAVVANPCVLFERAAFARLFAEREPRALAFGLLAGLGILCAVVALVIWLATPLFNG